jgi:hypothetical protein
MKVKLKNVKVNFTPEQAKKAQKALYGVGSKRHAPTTLPLREREPVHFLHEAGWILQPVWTGAEKLAPYRDWVPGPSSP